TRPFNLSENVADKSSPFREGKVLDIAQIRRLDKGIKYRTKLILFILDFVVISESIAEHPLFFTAGRRSNEDHLIETTTCSDDCGVELVEEVGRDDENNPFPAP